MSTEAEAAFRLDDQIGFLLRRAYQRASANLTEQLAGHDLTAPQFATLARLYECGAVSQNRLGRLVVMEPANIRDVVQRLLKRGLVETESDPEDKRQLLVRLSAAGRTLTQDLLPLQMDSTARTLAPLEPKERRILCDLLRRLAEG